MHAVYHFLVTFISNIRSISGWFLFSFLHEPINDVVFEQDNNSIGQFGHFFISYARIKPKHPQPVTCFAQWYALHHVFTITEGNLRTSHVQDLDVAGKPSWFEFSFDSLGPWLVFQFNVNTPIRKNPPVMMPSLSIVNSVSYQLVASASFDNWIFASLRKDPKSMASRKWREKSATDHSRLILCFHICKFSYI